MWVKEIRLKVVFRWATSSNMGVRWMLWHRWMLFIQFITIIESPKNCMPWIPFSCAKMRSMYNASSSTLLFVPSPSPHFSRKEWSSVRNKTAPAPQTVGFPWVAPSKYPHETVLSICSCRGSLIRGGFDVEVKWFAIARMLDATKWGVVVLSLKMLLFLCIHIP